MEEQKKKRVTIERATCLNGETPYKPDDPDAEKEWPFLVELLGAKKKDGQLTREGSTVNVRGYGSSYEVTINNPTERSQARFVVSSLTTMWDEIEAQLGSGKVVWGPDWETKKKARQRLAEDV